VLPVGKLAPGRAFLPGACERPRRLWHSRFRISRQGNGPAWWPRRGRQAWAARQVARKRRARPGPLRPGSGPSIGSAVFRRRSGHRSRPAEMMAQGRVRAVPGFVPRGNGLPRAQVADANRWQVRYRGQGTAEGESRRHHAGPQGLRAMIFPGLRRPTESNSVFPGPDAPALRLPPRRRGSGAEIASQLAGTTQRPAQNHPLRPLLVRRPQGIRCQGFCVADGDSETSKPGLWLLPASGLQNEMVRKVSRACSLGKPDWFSFALY